MPTINTASAIRAGTRTVTKAYYGSTKVWPPPPTAPPTNVVAKWTSGTVNTIQWTDSVTSGATYDVYYSDTAQTDWSYGTKIGSDLSAGVQTLTHNKSTADQLETMLYYGVIAKKGSKSPAVSRGVPRVRGAADWLPSTIGPYDKAIQGLVHLVSADVSKIVAVQVSGNYTVDWGDGSAPANFTSSTTATHTYTYASMLNDTAGGQRQALMTVTPQAGSSITAFTLANTSTRSPVEFMIAQDLSTMVLKSTAAANQLRYITLLGNRTFSYSLYTAWGGIAGLIGIFGNLAATSTFFGSAFFGNSAQIYFPDCDMTAATSANQMYYNCPSLTPDEVRITNTSNVTTFSNMFNGCSNAGFTTIPSLDTSKGTNFSSMFSGANKLTSLPAMNTSLGTDFSNMFNGCAALATYPTFTSVANGTNFASMFFNNTLLTNANIPTALTTGVGTGNGTSFAAMFQGCNNAGFTTPPALDTAKGTNFSNMFYSCNKLTSMPVLNTNLGTNFSYMFYSCTLVPTFPITSVSNGLTFDMMFYACSSLTTANIPAALTTGVGTGNGTNFSYMFSSCTNVGFTTIPLIDTSKGTNFGNMFAGCTKLTSLPALNTGAGTIFDGMFASCVLLPAMPITSVSAGVNFTKMFYACSALTTANIPAALTTGVGTGNGTNFNSMFYNCNNVGFTGIPLIDTSKGTLFGSMFYGCTKLTTAGVPAINTALGTDFSFMFWGCTGTGFTAGPPLNTSKGTLFQNMFYQCNNMTSIPLYDTALGQNFSYMFNLCSALTTAGVPALNTGQGTNFSYMFVSCNNAGFTAGPPLNTSNGTAFTSMFQNCSKITSLPAYDFSKAASSASYTSMFSGCSLLNSILIVGIKWTFTVVGTALTAAALNTLYTNLATVTAQTITVTSVPGAASDNPAIATAKGWTVTG